MTPASASFGAGFPGAVRRLTTIWAILGGVVLFAVVCINMISVLGGIVGHPFPGDFELTEMGVAVAVFAFLPYCQSVGANVTADIFTSGLRPRAIALLTLVGSLIALAFALLLIWRMYFGMMDQRSYDYMTAILQIPIWCAYVPVLISLALLALAALASVIEDLSGTSRGDGAHV
ncbi:MAG: transporter small permease protein [Cereibacter sp.]|jgi:TRAP-type C4-dicarboxylate transport system permease small subunit|nr:transporter small permease protein [Cereibacter sp.]